MEKCFFSNRIYKKDLPQKDVSVIQDALLIFNKAKHTAYKFFLDEYNHNLKYDISIHLQIKNRYGLNDYFANSAVQAAKVVLSSQKELNGQYQKNLNHQIKTRQKKIKDISKKINKKEKVLNSLVNGNFNIYPGAREFKKGRIYGIRYKKHTRIFFNAYDFEYQYLRPEIKN
ncbi:hypothetical protein [Candidatus Contubernalis alkaliaceticus]|uniref:hypothetical protein n=1 Tax=Candidatus Contubernalis alkaliaceticus TaxID=338645 RepID=UPI001F4C473E|nr:hypothetical protein [Candidatus Contubernalis alkalaceticus]UNC91728.1 hypothetical protein HUE98_06255 [Candidatus Contubernalis alkalaceticus]